ncbi:hypothetical protein [Candidatus Palauibacter sp.]|uniref:hypothetical protein n=1 Tax=Candidatus Palauibacter sp. TaxID=3101350 RepID=UPI003AF2BEC8
MTTDLRRDGIPATADADEDEAGGGLDGPLELRGELRQQGPGSGLVEDVSRQFGLGFGRSGTAARRLAARGKSPAAFERRSIARERFPLSVRRGILPRAAGRPRSGGSIALPGRLG